MSEAHTEQKKIAAAAMNENRAPSGAAGQHGNTSTEDAFPPSRSTSATRKDSVRQAAPDDAVVGALAAVWCRTVGSAWTLELHELDGGPAPGTIRERISTGVPIWQPAPETLAARLLADRGLKLFRDPAAGPRTRSRRGIGYACPDTDQ
ncbi:MAG: hypothetical protein ACRDS0_19425 [Pseudonocardiaceae bacterium]